EIDECCERLARRQQFLRAAEARTLPDGKLTARYGFIHALYQNAFYERVTTARRGLLHQRIGAHNEASYGARAAEIAIELSRHFEQGRDWERAVKYLTLAAQQANRVFAVREAAVLARHGLSLVEMLPGTRARFEHELSLQVVLGNALMATDGFAAAAV